MNSKIPNNETKEVMKDIRAENESVKTQITNDFCDDIANAYNTLRHERLRILMKDISIKDLICFLQDRQKDGLYMEFSDDVIRDINTIIS